MNQAQVVLLCTLCLVGFGTALKHHHVAAPNPSTIAQRITQQIVNNSDTFLQWDYGCSIIFDGMWEALSAFGGSYENILNQKLDQYETTPNDYGYNVLHNITIPWANEIGDTVGLFPIAYLARNQYYGSSTSYNNARDLNVAYTIARKYLVPYPYRLPDGTYSRQNGWPGANAGDHSFVWADDGYMGTALLARLAILSNDPSYLDSIVNLQTTYTQHLRDTIDGLSHHGYNNKDGHQSCCKWSRANGWLMMSHVEVLLALQQHLNYKPDLFQSIKSIFVAHARAAAHVQSQDGRWHQLLNETSTFLETSTTGMFLSSFITGVENGWLAKSEFDPVIQRAWRGLASTVQSNGVVTGICAGTAVGTSVPEYQARPTNYLASSPGLGSVLRAVTAYYKYSQNL